ncbi:hypothetical protein [Lysobacter gummosus]
MAAGRVNKAPARQTAMRALMSEVVAMSQLPLAAEISAAGSSAACISSWP